ncbi:MAG: DNA polymerase/3'-5' exonuclease PolX [Calditrichaceae bacterium]|nr:DNA polymerase/3'-5' exonuclease PolX [Calditrichaceae bacterium]
MNRKEIVKILEEIGTVLELKGENPFKSRAYYNAARTIESLSGDVIDLIQSGKISEIKGIGSAISEKLKILVNTGALPYYEELKSSIPDGLLNLLEIPGLGPKKVKTIYEKLNITSIGELEYACHENRLRDLDGFGEKSQDKILKSIELKKKYSERFHYPIAMREALNVLKDLKKNPNIIRVEIAGSLRRKKETVRDIDIVASCKEHKRDDIMAFFTSFVEAEMVVNKGQTKSTIILSSGIHCDLRLVNDEQFPFLLHHSTGSKEHNTTMRQRAKSMNLTMNEYGLFPDERDQSLDCKNESDIFTKLNLIFIEPELRENFGEIEQAEKNALPDLIKKEDIKGLFHVHTSYSDGAFSIKEMADHCRKMGFKYLGISDHSKSAFYANGLNEDRIKQQHEEIDQLNATYDDFTIFKGIESDILQDGQLDYSDDVLAAFDFVIASIHSGFQMSESAMTARICKALANPYVTMLGHPTGRLLLGREAYPLNMTKVLETASRYSRIVEINANPHRLDLDWRWGKLANQLRIKTAINPDAHSTDGLHDYSIGVGIARKGWFETSSVINTLEPIELLQIFSDIRAAGQ